MKMFLDDKEVNEVELKAVFDSLNPGDPDGGSFEVITLSYIDVAGNLFFDIEKHSTFGG